jgi:hypothetical protein
LRDVADVAQYEAYNPQEKINSTNEGLEKIRILKTTVSMLSQNAQKEFTNQLNSLLIYLKEIKLRGNRL